MSQPDQSTEDLTPLGIAHDALRRIAEMETRHPAELEIDTWSYCDYTPEDAECLGLCRGQAQAALIARDALERIEEVEAMILRRRQP